MCGSQDGLLSLPQPKRLRETAAWALGPRPADISAVSRRGLGACPSGPAGTNSLALYKNCGCQDSRIIKDSMQQPKGKGDGNKLVLRANYAFGKALEFR